MSATHAVRLPNPGRTTDTAPDAADTAAGSTAVRVSDRLLLLEVSVAAALGATAGLLATWAVLATQTLHMHF